MELFHPALAPFTIALLVMAFIALLEVVGLLFGVAVSNLVDSALPEMDFEADLEVEAELSGTGAPLDVDGPSAPNAASPGPFSQLLSWLCVGKVPILILLAAFLMGFGLTGLIVQTTLDGAFGFYLPSLIVATGALFVALPVTRHLGLAVSRAMPKEETDAVSLDTFVGRIAIIVRGDAKIDLPAEAKLKDSAGTTQYVLVAPDEADRVLPQGSEILLVQREGAVFRAILNTNAALSGG